MSTDAALLEEVGKDYKYGFHDTEQPVFKSEKGLTEEIVRAISERKNEPQWMLDYRLKALKHFHERPMPQWGHDLSDIDFANIHYYVKPSEKTEKNWDDVPEYIKETFDKLGIPEAERKFLAGVSAQYDTIHSEVRSWGCSTGSLPSRRADFGKRLWRIASATGKRRWPLKRPLRALTDTYH